jgi:DNA-binding MarR family transcriptional regulator
MKLSDDQSAVVTDAANQLHRSILRLFRVLRTNRPAKGLAFSAFGVLGRLNRDGMATATELAAYMRIKPQSLTRLIANLEQRGLIARRSNGEDRRQNLIEITKAGVQLLLKDISDQRVSLAQVIKKELTPSEQEMLRIAASLMDRVAGGTEAQRANSNKPKYSKS